MLTGTVSRYCRNRILPVVASGFVCLGAWAQPVGTVVDPEPALLTFSADAADIPYMVALDRVGVVVEDSLDEVKIAELAQSVGGSVIQSHRGGIQVISLPSAVTRDGVRAKAQDLLARGEVLSTGLVLYRTGYTGPVLAPDQLMVRFTSTPSASELEEFEAALELSDRTKLPLVPDLWAFSLKPDAGHDILGAMEMALARPNVKSALPNLILDVVSHQLSIDDPLFDHQWHHQNVGQPGAPGLAGSTHDADIDSELAWELTEGSDDVLIALIDTNFDLPDLGMPHPDLGGNLWRNPGEDVDPGGNDLWNNGIDDDSNGYDDDLHGISIRECSVAEFPNCGSGTFSTDTDNAAMDSIHGNAVAGIVAAVGNNIGVSGVCRRCKLMLIAQGQHTNFIKIMYAFNYVHGKNVRVLNNSWGIRVASGTPIPIFLGDALDAVIDDGTAIVWSMGNNPVNECGESNEPFLKSRRNVITVGASSNWDRKVHENAYGSCLDVLAPGYGGYGPVPNQDPDPNADPIEGHAWTGSLNMVTTDRPGNPGMNDADPPQDNLGVDPDYCPQEILPQDIDPQSIPDAKDYTLCFSGSSAATPVVAGIAGLLYSVDDGLSAQEIERLLIDTADKIEPSAANYGHRNGYSSGGNRGPTHPLGPDDSGIPNHGYGRVNAFEAVRIVAPVSLVGPSGLGGTDIFIRDNVLDWGNTAQEIPNASAWRAGSNIRMEQVRGHIPHYQSVDIKIDAPDSSGGYRPAPTNLNFDTFSSEDPVSGEVNRVYVRVHNRGPEPATNVLVKLLWSWAGPALQPLPDNFWDDLSVDPPLSSGWNALGIQTVNSLGYSGASVADTDQDQSAIVSFDFTGPALHPDLPDFRHHCLLAVIDSPEDPVNLSHLDPAFQLIPDIVTPTTNNVTHRNVSVQDPAISGSGIGLVIRNPFPEAEKYRLVPVAPDGWEISFSNFGDGQIFVLEPGEEVPVIVKIIPEAVGATGEVDIRQEILFDDEFHPFGGFVFEYAASH